MRCERSAGEIVVNEIVYTDAIHLVKDEGGHRINGGEDDFDGEHHAGQLTTGRALAERAGGGT